MGGSARHTGEKSALRQWARPALLVALAIGVRLVMIGAVNHWLWYGGMSTHFGISAEYLAQGRGYAISPSLSQRMTADQTRAGRLLDLEEYRTSLPTDEYPTLERPPAYSWLLATSYRLTGDHRYRYVHLFQVFADSLVCLLLFRLLTPWSRRAGYVAAGLYAVWPPVARNAVIVLPESFMPLLVAAIISVSIWAMTRRSLAVAALAGVLTGGAAYFRTEVLLLGFCLLPAFWFAWGSFRLAMVASAVFTAVSLTVLSPWLLRNHRLTGEWMLTNSVGPALWVGGGEYQNPFGMIPDVKTAVAQLEREGITDLVAQDRVFRERFSEAFRAQPDLFVTNAVRRFFRYLFARTDWGLVGFFTRSVTFEQVQSGGGGTLAYLWAAPGVFILKVVPWAVDILMVLAAIAGAVIGLRAGWPTTIALAIVPFYFIASRAPLAYDPRLAVPGYWAYPGLVAIAVDWGWAYRARKRRRSQTEWSIST